MGKEEGMAAVERRLRDAASCLDSEQWDEAAVLLRGLPPRLDRLVRGSYAAPADQEIAARALLETVDALCRRLEEQRIRTRQELAAVRAGLLVQGTRLAEGPGWLNEEA